MDNQIRVDMTPNPLDIQTIHCSQGDTEARQWGFELHNNGELIDTSDVKEQLFFKAYKGGTEEILPTNGSTPTTSPFKGDIKYPQGLLTDQEFTYRQSPTEEDGYAKIETIYGNTLVWNQLVQNGNFADTSKWAKGPGASSVTFSNNEAVITIGAALNNDIRQIGSFSFVSGHKYFVSFEAKATAQVSVQLATFNTSPAIAFARLNNLQTTFKKIASIVTVPTDATDARLGLAENGTPYVGETFTVRNVQIIDLTAMGLGITDPSDFTSLFPLPYYAYNQGTLLSFNGNGIKTTGFNQWDEEWEVGGLDVQNGNPYTGNSRIRTKNFNQCFENTVYYNSAPQQAIVLFYDGNFGYLGYVGANARSTFTTKANARYFKFYMATTYGTTYNNDICINISGDKNGTYEPYTSSTLSLPISTYFPTGMKSAGNVYDELTPAKAITRIGAVDLGTLSWQYGTSLTLPVMESNSIADAKAPSTNSELINCISVLAPTLSAYQVGEVGNGISIRTGGRVRINIPDMGTNANAFKTAMSGVMLYYELATPTETSFTTASLVTENAKIPLSNEDGTLIGKCTEELSENPGFIDAKIKLADADGECYSNKIQLHVERSPQ